MELKKIHLKNFGPFIDKEIEIKEGITAFVGPMGAGKTMALESAYATSFMEFATRSKRLQHFTRAKGEISTSWVHDNQPIDCKLNIEKDSMFGNISVDGKTFSFDTQAPYLETLERYVGNKNLWLATVLCAQTKTGSFVELSKRPRKDIFYQILNLNLYDVITEQASIRRREAEKIKSELEGKLSLIDAQIKEFEDDLGKENFQELQKTLFEQKTLLETLTEKTKQFPEYHYLKEQLGNIDKELASIDFSFVNDSIKNLDIAKANKELEILNAYIKDSENTIRDIETLNKELEDIQSDAEREKKFSPLLDDTTSDEDLKVMHANLNNYNIKITNSVNELARLNKEKKELESLHLYSPPCGDQYKTCSLKIEQTKAEEKLKAVNNELSKISDQAAINSMIKSKEMLESKIASTEKIKKSIWVLADLRRKYKEVRQKITALETKLGEPIQERNKKVIASQDTIKELHSSIESSFKYQELLGKHKSLNLQKDELKLKINGIVYDKGLEDKFNTVEKEYPEQNDRFIRLSERFNNVKALKEQKVILDNNLTVTNQLVSEYSIIEEMCGYNGIPSIEIDSALPEIEQISTELLNQANWNYKIRFETQKEGTKKEKDGYKILETLEISVLDGNDSLLKADDDLSVGQKSIITEAIGLALTILAKRNKIINIDTLFRDETTANLNKEAASNYIKLLRNAMVIGGFKNIIYITHQEFLLNQVDQIVYF